MVTLNKFDMLDHLDSPEMMAAYLDACLEEGGLERFLTGIGDVMRAMGVSEITRRAGIASRSSAYRSFRENGKPELRTVGAVLDVLGMRLAVVPKA